ncbi:MAG: SpoIIE family protein phosphatase [Bacteroidales bacterium]|nr:SpoIIE family protein phosphatase [Bacteroidales bacterium]
MKNFNDSQVKDRKELNESLKYASYIQKALLPSPLSMKKSLPEHFLIYMPRDIVSGDFYFLAQKKNQLFIAVADCTGHGVPGAFMSILGLTFLGEIIHNGSFSSASSVLNQMREKVMKAMQQTGDDDEQKDGIDMALGIIDSNNNKLNYAGAFNPIYIVKKNRILEVQGDKMPIGVAANEERSFCDHYCNLDEGDQIYFFTDGFVDQFGGPMGKKFKYQPFRSLLLTISSLPIHKQKEKLIETFLAWKGNLPQLDDVLLLGWRYHRNN